MSMGTAATYAALRNKLDTLPALDAVVLKLIDIVNSPDSSADDAATCIKQDPALTSRILRLANSAFYGSPRAISSVSSAVVVLGFNSIKALALSSSVIRLFAQGPVARFDMKQFWRHSIVCALAGREIIRSVLGQMYLDPESAFCAGIMHDIGKLVFAHCLPTEYNVVCEEAFEKKISICTVEESVFGVNHATVGKILSDLWSLPLDLEASIVGHHSPVAGEGIANLVAAIHIADTIAHRVNAGLWKDEQVNPVLDSALCQLFLTVVDYEALTQRVANDVGKSDEFLALAGGGTA